MVLDTGATNNSMSSVIPILGTNVLAHIDNVYLLTPEERARLFARRASSILMQHETTCTSTSALFLSSSCEPGDTNGCEVEWLVPLPEEDDKKKALQRSETWPTKDSVRSRFTAEQIEHEIITRALSLVDQKVSGTNEGLDPVCAFLTCQSELSLKSGSICGTHCSKKSHALSLQSSDPEHGNILIKDDERALALAAGLESWLSCVSSHVPYVLVLSFLSGFYSETDTGEQSPSGIHENRERSESEQRQFQGCSNTRHALLPTRDDQGLLASKARSVLQAHKLEFEREVIQDENWVEAMCTSGADKEGEHSSMKWGVDPTGHQNEANSETLAHHAGMTESTLFFIRLLCSFIYPRIAMTSSSSPSPPEGYIYPVDVLPPSETQTSVGALSTFLLTHASIALACLPCLPSTCPEDWRRHWRQSQKRRRIQQEEKSIVFHTPPELSVQRPRIAPGITRPQLRSYYYDTELQEYSRSVRLAPRARIHTMRKEQLIAKIMSYHRSLLTEEKKKGGNKQRLENEND